MLIHYLIASRHKKCSNSIVHYSDHNHHYFLTFRSRENSFYQGQDERLWNGLRKSWGRWEPPAPFVPTEGTREKLFLIWAGKSISTLFFYVLVQSAITFWRDVFSIIYGSELHYCKLLTHYSLWMQPFDTRDLNIYNKKECKTIYAAVKGSVEDGLQVTRMCSIVCIDSDMLPSDIFFFLLSVLVLIK